MIHRKKVFLSTALFMTLIALSSLYSQKASDTALHRIRLDGLWGYIDDQGREAIPPAYDEAEDFYMGLAKVKKGDDIFYINPNGQKVLDPNVIGSGQYGEGLIPFYEAESESWGYMNTDNEVAIEPQFATAYFFSDGLAAVNTNFGNSAKASWGFIDKTGEFVIPPQYYGARHFSEGLAPVLTGGFVDGKWGFVDRQGEMRIAPAFDEAFSFSDGLAAVDVEFGFDDSYGYINREGDFVIEAQYDFARAFNRGIAPVSTDDLERWKFINRQNERLFSGSYEFAEPFHGGLARVAKKASGHGHGHMGGEVSFFASSDEWIYIDRNGEQVWPVESVQKKPEIPRYSLTTAEIESLLPRNLIGIPRTELKSRLRQMTKDGGYPQAEALYRSSSAKEADLRFQVMLSYGQLMQVMIRSDLMQESGFDIEEIDRHEAYILEFEDEKKNGDREKHLQAVLFPGNFSLIVQAVWTESEGSGDGNSEQRARLREAVRQLRLGSLLEYSRHLAGSDATPGRHFDYTLATQNTAVRFSYPVGWQVVDLFEQTKFVPTVGIMRDPSAAADPSDAVSNAVLGNTGNALVTLSVIPEAIDPLSFLKSSDPGDFMDQGEYLRKAAPANFYVAGREVQGAELTITGQDSQGTPVIYNQRVFKFGGKLIAVNALLPQSEASRIEQLLLPMLSTLKVQSW